MRFLKFVIGGFLILGSIIFAPIIYFSAAIADSPGSFILWGAIDFFVFLGGLYLVIHH
jgi:hypothetical protein